MVCLETNIDTKVYTNIKMLHIISLFLIFILGFHSSLSKLKLNKWKTAFALYNA